MSKAAPLLAVQPGGTFAANMPLMLHTRLGEMIRYEEAIEDAALVTELHEMRIGAKRLRYTIELMLPYAPEAQRKPLSSLLDKTKRVQELIGEIHDRDVRVPLILRHADEYEARQPEVVLGLRRLAEREIAERDALYHQLRAYWREQRDRYMSRMGAVIGALIGRHGATGEE